MTGKDLWPIPGDSPLDRARTVARSYREALHMHLPELCARIDAHMVSIGQTWMVPRVAQYHDMDLLTPYEVAVHCQVEINTVYKWRTRGLRVTPTPDGDRYRLEHVEDYRAEVRKRRSGCA